MRAFKIALVAAALAGTALVSSSASAMPIGGLVAASNELAGDVQNVRWCGRYRCRGYYAAPVVVYPPVYYSPYYTYYGWPYYRPYWGWGWGWGPRWWW
jgi:hypothetical protein